MSKSWKMSRGALGLVREPFMITARMRSSFFAVFRMSSSISRSLRIHFLSVTANGSRYAPSGYWWVGRETAALPEPTPSHANCSKTRRLPPPHLHWRAVPVWSRCSSEGGVHALLGGILGNLERSIRSISCLCDMRMEWKHDLIILHNFL